MSEHERVESRALFEAVTRSGGRAQHVGGALCLAHPAVPIDIFNRAVPLGEMVDLDAIEAWFDAPYAIAVTPERSGLAAELAARGYENGYAWMKFGRDASPAQPARTDLRIEESRDASVLAVIGEDAGFAVASIIEGALVGTPGWTFFVGWADDQPAASGALFVDGRSAWLGAATTRRAFRGRGGQSAILARRIERARELGTTLLVTETGANVPGRPSTSYGNILRAGFHEAYLRANWHSPTV